MFFELYQILLFKVLLFLVIDDLDRFVWEYGKNKIDRIIFEFIFDNLLFV